MYLFLFKREILAGEVVQQVKALAAKVARLTLVLDGPHGTRRELIPADLSICTIVHAHTKQTSKQAKKEINKMLTPAIEKLTQECYTFMSRGKKENPRQWEAS